MVLTKARDVKKVKKKINRTKMNKTNFNNEMLTFNVSHVL